MEIGRPMFGDAAKRLWLFFAVMVVFWLISAYWWATMGYEGTFQWINQFRSEPLNYSSLYFFTNLGDGIILPGLILLFFWRKDPALAVTFALAFVFTGGVTQVAKRFLFEDWVRPTQTVFHDAYFQVDQSVQIFVKTITDNYEKEHSFPSGHATSFATGGVFFAWGMYEWRRWLPALVGIFTVFLCFTRVFLGVHFPGDIFVGSMIGSIGAVAVLAIAYPIVHRRLHGLQRLSNPKLGYAILGFAGLLIVAQLVRIALKY